MASLQVTCVTFSHPKRHENITYLGGGGWLKGRGRVISEIEVGVNDFYTLVDGKRAVVEVVKSTGQANYLRTRSDGQLSDDLLELPRCR
jgi:hypothetical protein